MFWVNQPYHYWPIQKVTHFDKLFNPSDPPYLHHLHICINNLCHNMFVYWYHQADNLRKQTLQQMHRILTTRQSARALIAINDYSSRLRALSSLWLARPREWPNLSLLPPIITNVTRSCCTKYTKNNDVQESLRICNK